MCNRSIPTGIGSLPEKPPSDSILSRASSVHTNAPSCCFGSCRLTLLTDITCPASAIIGCYLRRQTALSLWIQSCGYNCAAFHSGFPANDIRKNTGLSNSPDAACVFLFALSSIKPIEPVWSFRLCSQYSKCETVFLVRAGA